MRGGVPHEVNSTSIQGGERPLGGYQPSMVMEPSSPASAWQHHSLLPKQEPIDAEERNDSGISGSEFQSSSPGSENSGENVPYASPAGTQSAFPSIFGGEQHNDVPMGSHQGPLTPPNSEPMDSPRSEHSQPKKGKRKATSPRTVRTPSVSPPVAVPTYPPDMKYPGDDAITALRHLQMTMIHQGVFDSPKSSDGSDENKSDNETEEYNEHGVKVPKVNAHGKVKNFKCKQCDFVAHSKLEFWQHTRTHIKAEKRLTCPRCPFVTEYKHHLEYHLRNHVGSKPFKCTQCNYSCVNKSMLNSHLKSHSNVYQYRCANCSYASKYCHSLKLHLRKYNHHPDMVLNPDGTPNPFPIIDVYGTRRGPKVKTQESRPPTEQKPEYVLPFPFNRMTLNVPPHLQLPFAGFPFFGGFPTTMLMRGLEQLSIEEQGASTSESARGKPAETMETESSVLDLSKPGGSGLGRGEARAFEVPATNDEDSSDEETTMFSNVEVVENKAEERKDEAGAASNASSNSTPNANDNNNNSEGEYKCTYCSINFGDAVLYTMHMGYHGYRFPFTCNRCGEECHDKVSFFLHIARTPHS